MAEHIIGYCLKCSKKQIVERWGTGHPTCPDCGNALTIDIKQPTSANNDDKDNDIDWAHGVGER